MLRYHITAGMQWLSFKLMLLARNWGFPRIAGHFECWGIDIGIRYSGYWNAYQDETYMDY